MRAVKGWTLVIAAFVIVFAFSTVDHAISPMVEVLKSAFGVDQEKALWFITACTAGILAGLFTGPFFIRSYKAWPVSAASAAMMAAGLGGFIGTGDFCVGLVFRFIFGLGAGFVSTVLWWLAYESIDKKFYTPMITVLTASRPMAVAAGVPLVLYGSSFCGWQTAFGAAGILIVLAMIFFIWASPKYEKQTVALNFSSAAGVYADMLRTPFLKTFFAAMFINRLCYFGFYSMLGIWFIDRYGFSTEGLAKPLMIIGICETAINFIVPFLMKAGPKKLFYVSVAGNSLFFVLFIWGILPVWWAVFMIGLFAMTDRIYNMLLLIFIPDIFKNAQDRTVIGSTVTLVSWGSLAVISWLEGALLSKTGISAFSFMLTAALIIGIILYIKVLKRTVFTEKYAD